MSEGITIARNKLLALSAAMALMGSSFPFGGLAGGRKPHSVTEHANTQMPLNDEELQKLSALSGKAKKAFVRELKEKYSK